MLIPFLSVTAIGLGVALRRQQPGVGVMALAGAGLVGAWFGFLGGAVVGVIVDAVVLGGFWPTAIGHLAALGLARLAVTNRAAAALPAG